MFSAPQQFFNSLRTYADVEALVAEGETEGLYLECKSPSSPVLNKDMRVTLAKAISGFANTSGGVLAWGISTTKHQHGSLDVLSQLEPIANCSNFMRQITRSAITATTPRVESIESRIVLEKPGATRGIVLTYIPQTLGDPVRSIEDNHFYYRSGDEFTIAPYELIKRLFAATESPDLSAEFLRTLVKTEADGTWTVPILLTNRSSAVAENIKVSVSVENFEACDAVSLSQFSDASEVNPGNKIFMSKDIGAIHRGLNAVVGSLRVKMKMHKHAKRVLRLHVSIYANQMRARAVHATISLAKKGFSVTRVSETYIY
jgi:hypothetical protein